jgi:DNA-binding transcriptional LysR family regulator
MEMNLNALKIFHVTARMKSFTRAAEVLCLTQPGISKYIKDLETYYGVQLFDRMGKSVALTQAGEILLARVDDVFHTIEQVKLEIEDLQGLSRGMIRLGASITNGIYVLPEILGRFRSLYPHIGISLDIALNRQTVESLIRNDIDIGFLGALVADERIRAVPFLKDELVVIVPAGHPWALQDTVRPHDLAKEPFIISRPGSGTRRIIDERLKLAGVVLENVMEFGHSEAVKKAVETGLGVSILSRLAIAREERLGVIRGLRIDGIDMQRIFYFAHRKDKYLSAAAKAFLQHVVYSRVLAKSGDAF